MPTISDLLCAKSGVYSFKATAVEMLNIRTKLALLDLKNLQADIDVQETSLPIGNIATGSTWHAVGNLYAEVTIVCPKTLNPIQHIIQHTFTNIFTNTHCDEDTLDEMSGMYGFFIDTISNNIIDVENMIFEELSLTLMDKEILQDIAIENLLS